MTGAVLLLSENTPLVAKTTTVLESLEQDYLHFDHLESIQDLIDEGDILAVLVAFQDELRQVRAIDFIRHQAPNLAVYLVASGDQEDGTWQDHSRINGVIRYPIRYRDILEVVRQAELTKFQNRVRTCEGVTIIGTSPQSDQIKELVKQVAPTDANVLLSGESGTGKEVVARSIHHHSLRSDRPFVAVNCGAIPPELLESELFGHEKGSFTGAFQARAGRFELAEGGTLFLDEIGDMPLAMQVKLLRVIQERTFERVGGTKTFQSNVRIIAATHQNLERRISEGKFRTDLFYRLNVFPIDIPPLRDRSEDIPLLIAEFIKQRALSKRQVIEFTEDALQILMGHPLPGNVRELQNLVERLSILHPGETITEDKIPHRYRQRQPVPVSAHNVSHQRAVEELTALTSGTSQKVNLKQYLTSLERNLIFRALEQSDWVVTQAAKSLSLQRTTLIEKIRKLDIKPQERVESGRH